MTISQELIEAMDDCAEFGALHNRDALNDYHRRPLYVVQAEPVAPTLPFAQIELATKAGAPLYRRVIRWFAKSHAAPLIASVLWVLLVAFYAWMHSFPSAFPLEH